MKKLKVLLLSLLILCWIPLQALAIPDLQVYIPGATYDYITETWVIHSYEYELWITGATQTIKDVRFAAAVPINEEGSIEVTWLDNGTSVDITNPDYGILPTDGKYYDINGNFTVAFSTDSYTRTGIQYNYNEYLNNIYVPRITSTSELEPDPTIYGYTQNDTPVFGNGTDIPDHGVFLTDFYEYYIGDFDEQYFKDVYNYDSIEVDLNGTFTGIGQGMTKKFAIKVNGYTWVDLIAYDHYLGNNAVMYRKTPFSHDGAYDGTTVVPEPASMFLFGSGLLGFSIFGRKKLFNRKKNN